MDLSKFKETRYIRMAKAPLLLTEIKGYKDGKELCRDKWRASNLFEDLTTWNKHIQQTWKSSFVLDELPAGSYLCVAINGEHGYEGAYAGFKIDGKYVGCPDRATSYICNSWEVPPYTKSNNYTYYLPLTKDMIGKNIEAYVMSFGHDKPKDLKPEVWITAYPIPFETKTLSN